MAVFNFEPLVTSESDGILVVTITRPEAMNALNASVFEAFDRLMTFLESDAAAHLRGVVLTGAGEKAFAAGADIKEFVNLNAAGAAELSRRGQTLFARMERFRLPIIAAVNGFALGGGLELALACDFIYASENAKFGLPECTLGLMPGYGGTVRLPRRIGMGKAREMTYTGSMIDAQEAYRISLAEKIVPSAELLNTALATAKTIASRAPIAVAKIKRSILDGANLGAPEADKLECHLFGELFATEDKAEGVGAFLEKRKPVFKGQ